MINKYLNFSLSLSLSLSLRKSLNFQNTMVDVAGHKVRDQFSKYFNFELDSYWRDSTHCADAIKIKCLKIQPFTSIGAAYPRDTCRTKIKSDSFLK